MNKITRARLAKSLVVALLGLGPALAAAQVEKGDNGKVAELYRQDQADRDVALEKAANVDAAALRDRDAKRRADLRTIMAGGGLRTAQDYLRAAYLLQHGPDKDDPRIAHAMASLSWELDPHNKEARWLMAASWDRLMMSMGRPQWYGTQFDKPSEKFPWTLGAVDPRVTDAERATFFVPPLAESRKQLKRLNHASELLRK